MPTQWRNATVVSRGVLPCLVSASINPLTSDWNSWLQYDQTQQPYPPGVGSESFYSTECKRLREEAIHRGIAMGWKREDIVPQPVIGGWDDTVTISTMACMSPS